MHKEAENGLNIKYDEAFIDGIELAKDLHLDISDADLKRYEQIINGKEIPDE